ncbi:MAG: hypothetical protein NTZ56_07385 [Acidobacteria bacterium]|nr:hypothetical protein [Acidobacteriota bacterium]
MLLIAVAVLVTVAVLVMTLAIRDKDLPVPEPLSPFIHLDERKARIYENLRDLQFELRLGKLSDEDYASSKKALQQELAQVLAETEAVKASLQKKTA